MEYLIIDGYNVINAWPDTFNLRKYTLEDCRDKLIRMMSNYQGYKNANVIIVFDAHLLKGNQESIETYDNITVVFTKENETADNYIEKFVYRFAETNVIRVVTSDYLEQTMILNKGGVRVPARELKEELEAANRNIRKDIAKKPPKANTIESNLPAELIEKMEKIRRGKL